MRFRPEHYLEASQERIDDARRLHNMKRYAAEIYLAGVAVECLLIAYKTRKNAEFESRHDLVGLLRERFYSSAGQSEIGSNVGRGMVALEKQLPICLAREIGIVIQKTETEQGAKGRYSETEFRYNYQ